MRTLRIALILLLALVAMQVLGLMSVAQGPAGTWVSGIQIQNQSSSPATVTITFYWAQNSATPGAVAYTIGPVTIEGNKSVVYYLPGIADFPDNFVGSAVVSSDQPVAAILNTSKVAAGTESDPKRIGAASGVLSPATTVYAPYLRKNYSGRNSYIAVQNTSAESATVTITYRDNTGAEVAAARETATLSAYSTKIFYQNENAGLPNGFYGSAVINGTQPLAVVVNNANDGTRWDRSQFESYNGLTQSSTKLWIPKITANYSGYNTGLTIQNVGTAAATMELVSTFGNLTSPLIQPGAAWAVYLPSAFPSASGGGSATVTSSQPMVGVVTENKQEKGYGVVWSMIPDGSGTTTVLFPKFDRNYSGYNGGIQVQNIGTAPTRMQATFSKPGMTDLSITSPAPIPAGGSWSIYGPSVPGLPDGFNGSVTVVSLDGQPIAGIYTSKNDLPTAVGDYYSAYNGINK